VEKQFFKILRCLARVVNVPHSEARTQLEPYIYFWSPI